MRFVRDVQGGAEHAATVLAHYSDTAKKGTLNNVLQDLGIPEPIFWMIVSKTHKKMNVSGDAIKDLVDTISSKTKDILA